MSQFRKASIQPDLLPCKLCGSPAELHQELVRDDIWRNFGSCTNIEDIGGEPCLFHLPDDGRFFCLRRKDAAEFWNEVMGPRNEKASVRFNPA